MMGLKVHIYGVVGHNFGDEAIAVAAHREILDFSPDAHVSVASSTDRDLYGRYEISEIRNDRKSLSGIWNLIRSVHEADIVLIGGGTIIQDKLGLTLLQGNLAYALQMTLLAKILRKPVGTLAIGVDALESRLGPVLARWLVRLTDVLLVRDEQSMDSVQKLLNTDRKVKANWLVGADPAFLVEVKDGPLSPAMPFRNYMVLSLVNEGIEWEPFLDTLAGSVQRLLGTGAIDGIVMLAMDDRPTEELAVFERWLQKHPDLRSVAKVHVPEDIYNATAIIRRAKLMVAARLHAMILGLGAVPFLGISRTTKTDSFLEYTKAFGINAGSAVSPGELDTVLTRLLEDTETLEAQAETLQALKSEAHQGIRQLMRLLISRSSTGRDK